MAYEEPASYRITSNRFGWTDESFDPVVVSFIDYCATVTRPVLDVGAGHGAVTAAAVARGASVVAIDIHPDHLRAVEERVGAAGAGRLRTVLAAFPNEIELPRGAYDAALIARVLHFFDGPTLETSARTLFELLAPGGRVYASSGTPFKGNMAAFLATYDARVAAGDPYPGIVDDTSLYFPPSVNLPAFMNFLDAPVLTRLFSGAGFEIVDVGYFARPNLPAELQLDGRDGVAIIAAKPL
jgi:SAM-dependent methyltransferase